jgi:hypothetical protein
LTCTKTEHIHSISCYDCVEHTHSASCRYPQFKGYDANLWELEESETVTVESDGTTVLNVKFTRKKFKIDFLKDAYDKNPTYTIEEKWGDIKKWFDKNVAPKFTKAYWKEKFNGIKEGAREAFNGIIAIVEKAVNGIIRKLNTLHWSIPDWVPGVGGESFGFNIDEISIPRLAKGAVIPPNQEFLAVLGDQKNGRNLEAPEGLIRQIIREELSGLDIGGGDINIEFTGSLAQLARVLNPVITKEQKRVGGTLQTGGVI